MTPRTAAVKDGRRSAGSAISAVARPRLDGGEHGVTLGGVGAGTVDSGGEARQTWFDDIEIRSVAVRKNSMSIAIVGRSKRSREPKLRQGLVYAALAVVSVPSAVLAAEPEAIPNFASTPNTGWVASGKGFGVDFVQPPSGPGPVTNDPAYPYLTNAEATRLRRQPTYRVADLTNPILKPWAIAQMRKANDEVIAGKIPFTADSRCYPSGVPSFLLFPANPVRFIQTPDKVLMIWQQDAQVRHVYLKSAAFGGIRSRPGMANRSVITRAATPWWSTPSRRTTKPSWIIIARRTPRRCTSSSASS